MLAGGDPLFMTTVVTLFVKKCPSLTLSDIRLVLCYQGNRAGGSGLSIWHSFLFVLLSTQPASSCSLLVRDVCVQRGVEGDGGGWRGWRGDGGGWRGDGW